MTVVQIRTENRHKVATWSELRDREPAYALVGEVDLVVTRFDDDVSVLYGRCAHRRALMSDGHVEGKNLICGVHGWDYRLDTGVSEYNNHEALHKFTATIDHDDDAVYVDAAELVSDPAEPCIVPSDPSAVTSAGVFPIVDASAVDPPLAPAVPAPLGPSASAVLSGPSAEVASPSTSPASPDPSTGPARATVSSAARAAASSSRAAAGRSVSRSNRSAS